MTDDELSELVIRKALAILRWDDANPDVGMGMSYASAFDEAVKECLEEAVRWGYTGHLNFDKIAKKCHRAIQRRRTPF